jgi:hypothetical protein
VALRAYFDESGTQAGAPVLTVGGYISHAASWDEFSTEWAQAMTEYGIDHFHMNQFENRRGPFKDWPNHRRIPRLNRLMTIINRHTLASVGMSVDRVGFERVFSQTIKDRVRGPYGLALKGCLASLKRLSKDVKLREPIALVFAYGADQAGLIERETMTVIRASQDESRYIDVSFERRTSIPPLQAADIVAYDMCKEVARILGHHKRAPRRLLDRFEERYKHWGYMDEEELNRFMQRNAQLLAEDIGGSVESAD